MPKGIYKRKPLTEEHKRKLSICKIGKYNGANNPMFGKCHSEKTKERMSEVRSGDRNPMFNVRLIPWNKGKERTDTAGKLHWNWKGGISSRSYPREFNSALKLKIRTRDNFTCCRCRKTEREELEELNRVLCVNHIDFDKNNCEESNLNTLCIRCNIQINKERDYWTNFFCQMPLKPLHVDG